MLASDASLEQVVAGKNYAGVQRFVAEAHAQPLPKHSLELIVVAQALHWFATPAFFSEVRRLLKPGGVFCAWCYSLMRIDDELDALIDDLYWNTLGGYWPEGRSSVDVGYSDIDNPFTPCTPPDSAMESSWTLEHLLGYLRTWSAVQRYEQENATDPVSQLLPELQQIWGDAKQPRFVRWPLHFLAGTPN